MTTQWKIFPIPKFREDSTSESHEVEANDQYFQARVGVFFFMHKVFLLNQGPKQKEEHDHQKERASRHFAPPTT